MDLYDIAGSVGTNAAIALGGPGQQMAAVISKRWISPDPWARAVQCLSPEATICGDGRGNLAILWIVFNDAPTEDAWSDLLNHIRQVAGDICGMNEDEFDLRWNPPSAM